MAILEAGLKRRMDKGEIDFVELAKHRKEAHPLSPDYDQIDDFFEKIDAIRLHSSTDRTPPSEGEDDGSTPSEASRFTGFDDVYETIDT